MDRTLDEILAERKPNRRGGSRGPRGNGGASGGGGRRERERQDYPRDGVRKSFRERDEPRNLDSEWVHDRYEDGGRSQNGPRRRYDSNQSASDSSANKIRVDNLHYELTEEDLEGLFSKIGRLVKLELRYDRAGRSDGTAFVTYESADDAKRAIREYDGANAAGQPIRLTIVPGGPGPRRNPFDSAIMPGRPLSERITAPAGRSRSLSPGRRQDDDDAARKGIDRYRPGGGRSNSRSPAPRRREGGRRPGQRRGGGGGGGGRDRNGENAGDGGGRGGRAGRDGRPKKTQEELDAEMADYFGGGGGSDAKAAGGPADGPTDDIDMIE